MSAIVDGLIVGVFLGILIATIHDIIREWRKRR